jgi:hypothetical protein
LPSVLFAEIIRELVPISVSHWWFTYLTKMLYRVFHIKCSAEIYNEPSHSPSRWVQDKGNERKILKLSFVLLNSCFSWENHV